MKWLFLSLLIAFWANEFSSVLASFRVVCYYGSLSAKRDSEARFLPSNIDPRLCTDFVYAFAQVNGNSVRPIGDAAEQYKLYADMVDLKKGHPYKNAFLSVTNWKWKSQNYEQLANAIVDFLRLHKFDGLDVSSELPSKEKFQYYSQCIHTIRQAFEKEALQKGVSRLLLTSRITKVWQSIDNYNVTTINTNLDWLNLMTFDFHKKIAKSKTSPQSSVSNCKGIISKHSNYNRPLDEARLQRKQDLPGSGFFCQNFSDGRC